MNAGSVSGFSGLGFVLFYDDFSLDNVLKFRFFFTSHHTNTFVL